MNSEETQEVYKEKSKKKIWILFLVLILLMFAAIGILLFTIVENDVKLITFKGEQQLMTGVIPEEFANMYGDTMIIFEEDGEQTSYAYNKLGIEIQWTDEQKRLFDKFIVDLDKTQVRFNYSEDLQDIVEKLNKNRKDWKSATFTETESAFILTEEQEGNKVDVESIGEYINSNLTTKDLVLNLDDFKYSQPEDFITVEKYNDEFSKWSSFCITYSNGFAITAEDVKPFFNLTDEYKIVFKQDSKEDLKEKVQEWVNNDLESYNTLGGTFKFLTHDGEEVELKGVNYGDIMDKQKEIEFLVEAIENLQPYSQRIPVMSIDDPDDIQSNIIEVSIEDQHLWYWQNGEVVMETDIVTGWKDKTDTPKGVYKILDKINGTYLAGVDYKVWVDKWIRFWHGYGLHDAMWRYEFGDDIYTWDGSHGCVNLPRPFAGDLYDMINIGDCVVIY